jgi:nitrogen fixation protein NifB
MQCVFCDRQGFCRFLSSQKQEIPELSAQQALFYLKKMILKKPSLKAVNITGPGEVLLEIDKIQQIISSVRQQYPDLKICIQTNGILLEQYAEMLSELGIDNIILNINALNKDIAAQMYAWVRMGKNIYRGSQAAEIIIKQQRKAMKICREKGFNTRIHSLYVPCLNDLNIVEIARKTAEMGLDSFSCVEIDSLSHDSEQLQVIKKQCSKLVKLKKVVTIDFDSDIDVELLRSIASGPLDPIQRRPYYAVATLDGLNVNRHLGQARELNIYRYKPDCCELVDVRAAPPAGGGEKRWEQLSEILCDCSAIFITDAGSNPIRELTRRGIKVVRTEDNIYKAISALCRNVKTSKKNCSPLDCSTCSGC